MKTTLIGPVYPYRGGIAHYTTQLALALKSAGHICKVISFYRQYPSWLYPGGSDKDPSLTAVQVPAEFLLDPFNPWTWRQCCKRILDQNPDFVLLQWWTTYWTLPFSYLGHWCRRQGIPLGYLIHNVLPHEEKAWDRSLVKLALSTASGFIVQTKGEQERLMSLIPQANIKLAAHPAYTMLTSQRVDKIEARQRLGLPLDGKILLFFGIVRPYKGLKYLIEALSLLKSRGQTPTLLVAGDFWEDRAVYYEQVKAAGLSNQVILDDRYIPDEDAAVMFSAGDILVAPYIGGTQSGVAGIAIGFGMPMIVTEQIAAGIPDGDPEIILTIPPADAQSLADAIEKISERSTRNTSVQLSRQNDWGDMVATIESLYHQIKREG